MSNQSRRKKSNAFFNAILLIFAVAVAVAVLFRLGFLDQLISGFDDETTDYSVMADFNSLGTRMKDLSEDQIRSREPIYVVELNEYTAPQPDSSKYDKSFENYSDKTIEVHYSCETMHDSVFHFVEVKIKHPSQFRLALANDKYGNHQRKLPSRISSEVNAVVAVNGCFYNRRLVGFLMYRRKILRNSPFGVDTLLIDSNGNFHIVEDYKISDSGVMDEYDIINAISFGPELVRDGQALKIRKGNWEPYTNEPRTAICQYEDDLHYLICLAEGRNRRSVGVTMQVFANEIANKGVDVAYNLDGGQSGTLIIGNHLKNVVGWGPEKAQSDILYFATALKEDQRD